MTIVPILTAAAGVVIGIIVGARAARARHNREIEALAQRAARLSARAFSDGHIAGQARAHREHLTDLERIRAIGDAS